MQKRDTRYLMKSICCEKSGLVVAMGCCFSRRFLCRHLVAFREDKSCKDNVDDVCLLQGVRACRHWAAVLVAYSADTTMLSGKTNHTKILVATGSRASPMHAQQSSFTHGMKRLDTHIQNKRRKFASLAVKSGTLGYQSRSGATANAHTKTHNSHDTYLQSAHL